MHSKQLSKKLAHIRSLLLSRRNPKPGSSPKEDPKLRKGPIFSLSTWLTNEKHKSSSDKHSLANFVSGEEKLITVMGVFLALTVYSSSVTELLGNIFPIIFLIITLLLLFDFLIILRKDIRNNKPSIPLILFFGLLIVIFFLVILFAILSYFPDLVFLNYLPNYTGFLYFIIAIWAIRKSKSTQFIRNYISEGTFSFFLVVSVSFTISLMAGSVFNGFLIEKMKEEYLKIYISNYVSKIDSGITKEKYQTLELLTKFGRIDDEKISNLETPSILHALDDANTIVQVSAIRALPIIENKVEVTETLVRILGDEDESVRNEAKRYLSDLCFHDVSKATVIAEVLENKHLDLKSESRKNALDIIADAPNPTGAAGPLINYLSAANGLSENNQILHALRYLYFDDQNFDETMQRDDVTSGVLKAIQAKQFDFNEFSARNDAETILGKGGSKAVESLIGLLENEDDFFVKSIAINSLAVIKDARAIGPISEIYSTYTPQVISVLCAPNNNYDDAVPMVRMQLDASYALVELKATQPFLNVLKTEVNRNNILVIEAAEELIEIGEISTTPDLIAALYAINDENGKELAGNYSVSGQQFLRDAAYEWTKTRGINYDQLQKEYGSKSHSEWQRGFIYKAESIP